MVVVNGGWGAGVEEKKAIFCDKLTNLGWLTLRVLKYLMKTKQFIHEVLEKIRSHFFSSIGE
jgi:hypothetical protein